MRVGVGRIVRERTDGWLPIDCRLRRGFLTIEREPNTSLVFSRGIGGGETPPVRGLGKIIANVERSYRRFRRVRRAGWPTLFQREGGEIEKGLEFLVERSRRGE